jgi:hypothetical protein
MAIENRSISKTEIEYLEMNENHPHLSLGPIVFTDIIFPGYREDDRNRFSAAKDIKDPNGTKKSRDLFRIIA